LRIRVIDIEGTPQELTQVPQLRQLLGQGGRLGGEDRRECASSYETSTDLMLPVQVREILDLRSPAGPIRKAIDAFLVEVLGWGDVEVRIGLSKMSKDGLANMIRLHRRGSGLGAFVYLGVAGANLQFRLSKDEDLAGYVYARARNVQPDAPYGITLRLTRQSLDEAMRLARKAYQEVLARSVDSDQRPAAL
jgi:hypothetical protein